MCTVHRTADGYAVPTAVADPRSAQYTPIRDLDVRYLVDAHPVSIVKAGDASRSPYQWTPARTQPTYGFFNIFLACYLHNLYIAIMSFTRFSRTFS